jgi:hypothetical protein
MYHPTLCWCVLCSPAFLSVPALGSTGSAAGTPALFVGFAEPTAPASHSDLYEDAAVKGISLVLSDLDSSWLQI